MTSKTQQKRRREDIEEAPKEIGGFLGGSTSHGNLYLNRKAEKTGPSRGEGGGGVPRESRYLWRSEKPH